MRASLPKHERRWASDTLPGNATMSTGTSPGNESDEEFVEVTLDLQGDDTIVLRSVEPATSTVINIDDFLSLLVVLCLPEL